MKSIVSVAIVASVWVAIASCDPLSDQMNQIRSTMQQNGISMPDLSNLKMPDLSNLKMPDMSNMPSMPDMNMDMPDMPDMPDLDLEMPDMPNMPSMPDMPSLPNQSQIGFPQGFSPQEIMSRLTGYLQSISNTIRSNMPQ